MGIAAIDRVVPAEPVWERWNGAAAADPVTAGSRVETAMERVDMGIVEQGANSAVKALTLQYAANFDDSVWSKVRVWCANIPRKTGHTWRAKIGRTLTFPASAITNPMTGDANLPGHPDQALTADAAGPASTGTDVYNVSAKRLQQLHIQLQCSVSALVYEQLKSPYASPILVIEVPRTVEDNNSLNVDFPSFDEQTGQLFTFTDVTLARVTKVGDAKYVEIIGGIKDESINLTSSEEHINWDRYKPLATVQTARASFADGVTFRCDNVNPVLMGWALQSQPINDTARQRIVVKHQAKLSNVIEQEFMVMWTTLGGYIATARFPRATLTCADYTPGEQDFSGREFTLSGKAYGVDRTVVQFELSTVPVEYARIPIIYGVEEAVSA